MSINGPWHKRHPMPKNPTAEQRVAWHLEHARTCACRPIPPKLQERIDAARKGGAKTGAGKRRRPQP